MAISFPASDRSEAKTNRPTVRMNSVLEGIFRRAPQSAATEPRFREMKCKRGKQSLQRGSAASDDPCAGFRRP